MADSLTLIVLVATGWTPAGTEALLRAAHESLGPETHIDLREVAGGPTDAQALRVERGEHADAVVELGWKDRNRRQATLRVHVARGRRWIDRPLAFEPFDVEVERGRTLGYAMAAILPEPFPHHIDAQAAAAQSEPAPPAPAPSPAPPGKPAPDTKAEQAASPARTGLAPPQGAAAAIDVIGLGAIGIAGDAAAVGGAAAAHWFFLRPFSLRLGAGVKGGSIDIVGGRTLTPFLSAGLAVHPRRATLARPFGLSIRADFLALNQRLTQPSSSTEKQDLFFGMDAVVDASWMFVQGTEVLVGTGVEGVFSPVRVTVDGQSVTTIPQFRVTAEVGFRFSF
jgi:hypothetical protein